MVRLRLPSGRRCRFGKALVSAAVVGSLSTGSTGCSGAENRPLEPTLECSGWGNGLSSTDLGLCNPTLATSPAVAESSMQDGITVVSNLHIARRGTYDLHGDLHVPERAQTTGALVVVHGGGWLDCANRRQGMAYYAHAVAGLLEVPTFRIDYRLVQEGGAYPENVMDVKCGVQWLRDHAADYQIDPDRIGIMGTSAGAHLAAMVAVTEDRDDFDPGCGSRTPEVSLTLAYSGPFDLPLFVDGPSVAADAPLYYTAEDCRQAVPTCEPEVHCSTCIDASPASHACHADDDPIILFHAPDPWDEFVPERQARTFAASLAAAGRDVQLVIPSPAQMDTAGCPNGTPSHGADPCMLNATSEVLSSAVLSALGPR